MTVLLRFGTEAPADEITPRCPTLAMLCEKINTRLCEPLIVDNGTYAAAEAEMKSIRKARGYSTLPVAQLPQRNFLLYGVPIVAETEIDG